MNTETTPDTLETLAKAVQPLARLFSHRSSDPKYNAQQNLSGITHYVDDDTLRWHKSRVLSCSIRDNHGLLLSIITSDALDMRNTSRGFRFVVFDVFGTVVERPELDATFATSKAAAKARDAFLASFDVLAHYRAALASKAEQMKYEMERIQNAIARIA